MNTLPSPSEAPNREFNEITVRLAAGRVKVNRVQPDLTQLFTGRHIDDVLSHIPLLLPLCGVAQQTAAKLAVDAAQGKIKSIGPNAKTETETSLIREQAIAAAFRLCVDYPALLKTAPNHQALREVIRTEDPAEMAAALNNLLGDFQSVIDGDVSITGYGEGSTDIGAQILKQTQALDNLYPCGPMLPLLKKLKTSEELLSDIRQGLRPESQPVIAGPLASRRHPLTDKILSEEPSVLSSLFIAQLIDTAFIAEMLQQDLPAENLNGSAAIDDASGLGFAQTSRGPVFHLVALNNQDQVIDWQILAPTDWHFAASGPVSQPHLAKPPSTQWLNYWVRGFDPCAPVCVGVSNHA